jgi:hypothetical protein
VTLPVWFQNLFTLGLQLSHWQQLGLAFLVGSFTVATLSDLKYLSAQKEFLEVWLLFALGALVYDSWLGSRPGAIWQPLAVKWVLILGLSVASWREVGWLFRLAPGDVAALAAAACLLPPLLVVLLYLTSKVLSYPLAPVLRRGRPVYPFMPVVTLATLAVLALGLAASAQD